MEQEHRDLIRSNYSKLANDLTEATEGVCNYLLEKDVITKPMKQNILSEQKPIRKSSALLDLIENRGPRAFSVLYESCKQNGLIKSADILRPDKAPHKKTTTSNGATIVTSTQDEQPLPDTWPTKEHHERVKNKQLVVKTVSKDFTSSMFDKYRRHLNFRDQIYPMFHKTRGNALIIINKHFPNSRLKMRSGSEFDKLGLRQLFEGLGFKMEIRDDQEAHQIKMRIEDETKKDHSDHDCFVFFILSHGRQGEVFGTDGRIVKIKEIVETFRNVPDLKGKPKLLFFQACLGESDDKGHVMGAQAESFESDVMIHPSLSSNPSEEEKEEQSETTSDDKDVFEFKAAPDGLKTYRHKIWGSWFAQAVIYVFSEYSYRCDFHELTQKVKLLLSKAETCQQFKNVAELKHTPGRSLYFFPGLHEEDR